MVLRGTMTLNEWAESLAIFARYPEKEGLYATAGREILVSVEPHRDNMGYIDIVRLSNLGWAWVEEHDFWAHET